MEWLCTSIKQLLDSAAIMGGYFFQCIFEHPDYALLNTITQEEAKYIKMITNLNCTLNELHNMSHYMQTDRLKEKHIQLNQDLYDIEVLISRYIEKAETASTDAIRKYNLRLASQLLCDELAIEATIADFNKHMDIHRGLQCSQSYIENVLSTKLAIYSYAKFTEDNLAGTGVNPMDDLQNLIEGQINLCKTLSTINNNVEAYTKVSNYYKTGNPASLTENNKEKIESILATRINNLRSAKQSNICGTGNVVATNTAPVLNEVSAPPDPVNSTLVDRYKQPLCYAQNAV